MLHKILKDFDGSQDGRFCETFKAGTECELTPYLAEIVVREGWAEPVKIELTLEEAIEHVAPSLVAGGEYEGREDYVVNGIASHYKADAEEVRTRLQAACAPHKAAAEAKAAEEKAAADAKAAEEAKAAAEAKALADKAPDAKAAEESAKGGHKPKK